MKCECDTCKGSGIIEVTCQECAGEGQHSRCISTVDLKAMGRLNSDDLERLEQIQSDAARCQDQAERLTQINPACANSYADQLLATLAQLNQEADAIVRKI